MPTPDETGGKLAMTIHGGGCESGGGGRGIHLRATYDAPHQRVKKVSTTL